MAASADHIADYLIALGHRSQRPMTHLDVQKLLFFVQGWHLAMVGEPATDEAFLGPVVPSVYQRLRRYGKGIIPEAEVRSDPVMTLDARLLDLTGRVFETYREHDPGALVGLAHLPGTPWRAVRERLGLAAGEHSTAVIPTDTIREWFDTVLAAALEPATDGIVHADPEDYAGWVSGAR